MASSQSQRPPDTISTTEGPELGQTSRPWVPAKQLNSDYPLIDSDPHFTRVVRYARTSDYLSAAGLTLTGPAFMAWLNRISPTETGPTAIRNVMRLTWVSSACAGFLLYYSRSQNRFYGFSENRREIELDMREMTDRVKRGEPLYGTSTLSAYLQGAASRQSRYSGTFLHVMPWFNFVNHGHHGVDTAKYYQNAERELEAERKGQ